MTDLDALEALLAKATPGEWKAAPFSSAVGCPITAQPDPKRNTVVLAGVHGAFRDDYAAEVQANAAAIVALRNAAPDLIAKARRVDELEAALRAMLHAVCHETGFAAAVRQDSGLAYPWEPLDIAEAQARAALKENTDATSD